MSNQKTILPLGSAAQADNDPHRMDYIRRDQMDAPAVSHMSAQEIVAAGIVGGGMVLIVTIILSLIQTAQCWGESEWLPSAGCTTARALFWFYIIALVVGLVATVLVFLWGRFLRVRAEYARSTLTRDRWSNPVSAVTIHKFTAKDIEQYFTAAAAAEIKMAPYKALPAGLDSYSVSNSSTVPQITEGELVDEPVTLLPPSEWIPWFDARPHGLLAAETGGGKSTLFKLITKSRIERGELVFLLDPHSSDWFGLPGIGGGEDWEAIWCGMRVVIEEYKLRLDERESYLQQFGREKPTADFPRITVLLDEANTACRKFSIARRGEETRWEQFAEALGSGARKVNLSIQLLAQSPNVEDLELSRPMLNNFTRICLDAYTAQLLVQKSLDEKEQKQALTRAIQGQEYPAATTIKGYAVLLDRTGLDRITPPIRPERALWAEGYARAEQLIAEMRRPKIMQQPARPVVSAQTAQANPTIHTSMPVSANDNRQTTPQTGKLTSERKKALIAAMKRSGRTRKEARSILLAMGEGLDNDDWADAA